MLTNTNVETLETMAQDFLQYRYEIFCNGRRDADRNFYKGACAIIEAFGGEWRRNFHGDDNDNKQLDDANYYSHSVIFPNKERCARLNKDAWK